MFYKKNGFSLFELLVVVAIIAVVSAIVTPQIIGWRNSAKLRGTVDNLKGDLEMAKIQAVKENSFVSVLFDPDGYRVFVDRADPWVEDGNDRLLTARRLPAGVSFDTGNDDWGFTNNRTRFNSRGIADTENGTAVVVNNRGEQSNVVVSTLGRIRVVKIH